MNTTPCSNAKNQEVIINGKGDEGMTKKFSKVYIVDDQNLKNYQHLDQYREIFKGFGLEVHDVNTKEEYLKLCREEDSPVIVLHDYDLSEWNRDCRSADMVYTVSGIRALKRKGSFIIMHSNHDAEYIQESKEYLQHDENVAKNISGCEHLVSILNKIFTKTPELDSFSSRLYDRSKIQEQYNSLYTREKYRKIFPTYIQHNEIQIGKTWFHIICLENNIGFLVAAVDDGRALDGLNIGFFTVNPTDLTNLDYQEDDEETHNAIMGNKFLDDFSSEVEFQNYRQEKFSKFRSSVRDQLKQNLRVLNLESLIVFDEQDATSDIIKGIKIPLVHYKDFLGIEAPILKKIHTKHNN